MPTPSEGETRQQYMGRCIPQRHKEHPTEDNKQSVAICFSMWRKMHPKDKGPQPPENKK